MNIERKNLLFLLLEKVNQICISGIMLFIVARYYGSYDFGIYEYTFSLAYIFGIFNFMIDIRIAKKYFAKKDFTEVYYNLMILRVCTGTVIVLSSLIFLHFSSFNHVQLYAILLAAVIIESFGNIERAYLEFTLNSKYLFIGNLVASSFYIFFILYSVYLELPLNYLGYVYLFMSICKWLIWLKFRRSIIKFSFVSKCEPSEIAISILKESFPLGVAAVSTLIYSRVDRLMIGNLMDFQNVGIYSVATQISSFLIIFITPLQSTLFPRLLKYNNSNRSAYFSLYSSYTNWSTLLGLLFYLLIVCCVSLGSGLLLGQEYVESLNVFIVYGLGSLVMYNGLLRSTHLSIVNQGRFLLYGQIIGMSTNIILNLILIPPMGCIGAALSSFISIFISIFVSNFLFKPTISIGIIQFNAFKNLILLRWRLIMSR